MPALTEQQQTVIQELQRRREENPDQFSERQSQALSELLRRSELQTAPTLQSAETFQGKNLQIETIVERPPELTGMRATELAGSGFNKGLIDFAEFMGMPVDAVATGLRQAGIPIPEKPFFGSELNKEAMEAILPPIATPETGQERVLFRIAREAGATVPMTAGAVSLAKKSAQVGQGLLQGIRAELATIPPGKLLLVEQALAGSAGFGAGVLNEIFPEGGAASDFIGELLGTFGGSAVASLVRGVRTTGGLIMDAMKAKSTDPIQAVVGKAAETLRQKLSGEGSKRQTLGEDLAKLTTKEDIGTGIQRVEDIQREIPDFRPTTGQTFESPGVIALERGFEARDPRLVQDFEARRQQNRDAVRAYIDQHAPPGDKEQFVQRLQQQREESEALLNLSLDRTQAKIEIAKGDISDQTARVLDAMERRMQAADQRADAALTALRPRLTEGEAGEIIRREYLAELDDFRTQANARYENVDPQDLVQMPAESVKAVAEAVQRGYRPQVELPNALPEDRIRQIADLPDTVSFNTLRTLRSSLLKEMQSLRRDPTHNAERLRRLGQLLDGVEYNMDELVTDGRLRELYGFQSERYQELVSWYRHGAERLKQGTAAKLRTEDGGGRWAVLDEQVADRFLKGETSVDDFLQALGGRPQAREALQDRLRLDFFHHVVNPTTGRVNPDLLAKWQQRRRAALALYPDLGAQFQSATTAQRVANQVRADAQSIARDPERMTRIYGYQGFGKLSEAERTHAAILDTVKQTKKQWEKAAASIYLQGNDVDRMSRSILASSKREQKINEVLKEIGQDPIARNGFIRALWDASLDKFSVKAIDANENPVQMARLIRQYLVENEGWMTQLFGPERLKALNTAKQALAKLEISGKSPQPGGSDTMQKLFASLEQFGMPILARLYAHERHVVSKGFIMLEQVGRRVLKALGRFSDEQAVALLEEAFFDPKVAQTIIMSSRGVHVDHIAHRLRLHLASMNQGNPEE